MRESILKALADTVGARFVLTEREKLVAYSGDATGRSVLPDVVVCPEDVEQVAAVARLCTEERIPLTPRGAGTGLSGGSVPLHGGVLLSLAQMKQIRAIVSEDLYAVVESGTVTGELTREIEASSLFYPLNPASQDKCTVGGNVATSARGLRGLKYGTTKNYVLGLELVLPTGEIMNTGGRTVKNVAGFDLTRLVCGSEGTLAVVTAVTLKLIPIPEHRVMLLAAFENLERAAGASAAVVSAGITPSMLDVMDSVTVDAVSGLELRAFPPESEGRSLLLAETDGFTEAAETEAQRIEEICSDAGAIVVRKSSDNRERNTLLESRRSALHALARLRPIAILEDVSVPRSRVADIARAISEAGAGSDLVITTFGHAGEGNLHCAILLDSAVSENVESVEKIVSRIAEKALSLGGAFSDAGGIGADSSSFRRDRIGDEALETMKRLKSAFDPEGILNPGKLLTDAGPGA